MGNSQGTPNGVAFPYPRDHRTRVGEQRVHGEHDSCQTEARKNGRPFSRALSWHISTRAGGRSGRYKHRYEGNYKTGPVPSAVRLMHNWPDWVVCPKSKLGNTRSY